MKIKNIYATITDHVQMVGYREIVEIHAKARGLAGFVFNDIDGSVKLMASGPVDAINGLLEDLKARRPDTVIESAKIKEDIKLPSPFGRIVISNKLDTLPERIAEEIIGCFGNYLSFAAYSKLNATYTG